MLSTRKSRSNSSRNSWLSSEKSFTKCSYNSFEAFSLHAPAALLALIAVTQTGALQGLAVPAALLQPLLRLLYLPAYIANVAPLRGLCWASALLCTGILYLEAAKALVLA